MALASGQSKPEILFTWKRAAAVVAGGLTMGAFAAWGFSHGSPSVESAMQNAGPILGYAALGASSVLGYLSLRKLMSHAYTICHAENEVRPKPRAVQHSPASHKP
jgi:hypothetical protein